MDEYRDAVRRSGAVPIGAIMNDFSSEEGPQTFSDNQPVVVAGVIDSHRTRTTKNNSLMCYVQLEDDSGTMELIVFQKALDTGGGYLREGEVVVVRGRISARDEKEPQLMADSIRPISDLTGRQIVEQQLAHGTADQKLWVRLPSRGDPRLKKIELMLVMFPGEQQMVIYIEDEKKRIGTRCLLHRALIRELQNLCGEQNVVLK
jgi:DNA polymerase-3 subunit alpha